jgi:hypothetical protein
MQCLPQRARAVQWDAWAHGGSETSLREINEKAKEQERSIGRTITDADFNVKVVK